MPGAPLGLTEELDDGEDGGVEGGGARGGGARGGGVLRSVERRNSQILKPINSGRADLPRVTTVSRRGSLAGGPGALDSAFSRNSY